MKGVWREKGSAGGSRGKESARQWGGENRWFQGSREDVSLRNCSSHIPLLTWGVKK